MIPLLSVALAMSLILGFSITKPKRGARITFRVGNPPGGLK